MTKLDDIIRRQAEAQRANQGRVDWNARRERWVREIGNLFQTVSQWLQPHVDHQLVQIERMTKELHEQYLGSYQVPWLHITISGDVIDLVPKASVIVGGYGRVDMRGPDGAVYFVLQDLRDEGKGSSPAIDWRKDKLVWQIPRRLTTRFEYLDLTPDTFALALEQVLRKTV
jgi:hypothetical protein